MITLYGVLRSRARAVGQTGAVDRIATKARFDEPWLQDCQAFVRLKEIATAPFGVAKVLSPMGVGEAVIAELFS